MVKLVLAIVVIGILQFGFVMYSSVQEPVDVALAPVQTESDPAFPEFENSDAPASSADAFDEEAEIADDRNSFPALYKTRSASTRTRSLGRRYSARSVRKEEPRPLLPGDFRTIVISYGGPSEPHTPRRNCDSPEPERPKQRTAFAKAEPAIVRPWQVITTFDSKIN